MIFVDGKNILILENKGIVTSYNDVRFYKSVIVLEKSEKGFLI